MVDTIKLLPELFLKQSLGRLQFIVFRAPAR
jgi:hypothetical protein